MLETNQNSWRSTTPAAGSAAASLSISALASVLRQYARLTG
jgi:hypothetical protein